MAMRLSFHYSTAIRSGLIKSKTPAGRLMVPQPCTARGGESPHPTRNHGGAAGSLVAWLYRVRGAEVDALISEDDDRHV
jgi:hypothetical protein